MTRATTRALIAAVLLAPAAIAWAETGDAAFKRGQAAFKAGRIHEACEAFAASEKLEAKVETELALAECYEQDGKPVAAAHLYRALAEKDANTERRKTSSEKVVKLEAKAAKLRILPSQRPDGLVIKVDGVQVPSTGDVLVDAGPHEVIATAPGFEGHASAPIDRDRQILDVIVRLEPRADATPTPTPTPTPILAPTGAPAPTTEPPTSGPPLIDTEPEHAGGGHRKRNGAIIGAVGVGALVGSVVFFASSSSKFDDEHNLCPTTRCATAADLTKAQSLLSDGHTFRGVSIAMGIGGVALVGLGAYMFFTHKEAPSRISFQVGHDGAGLTYLGDF